MNTTETNANRMYKDTVFRKLFSKPEHLLSLYNALMGTHYTVEDDLEIVTLDSAIYLEMKNDVAFVIGTGLYLYEHQSTKNPNMPLRDLLYIASEYNKLVSDTSLYSTVLCKIPSPKFVVFYNGVQNAPEQEELLLSSAYTSQKEINLELKVTVFNINAGYNKQLMEQCKTLHEYVLFTQKIRTNLKNKMELNQAVIQAVDECIHEGILADFLRENKSEVIDMSVFEYDKVEEERKLRETERKAGVAEGIELGKIESIRELAQKWLAKGKTIAQIADDLDESEAYVRELLQESLT